MNWGEVAAEREALQGLGMRWLSNRVSRNPDDILRQRGALCDGEVVRLLVRCKQAWDTCTCHVHAHVHVHVSACAQAM